MSRVKSDLEAKVSSVSNVVHQYAASGSVQRTPSGENRSRATSRGRKRSKSPWRQTTNDLAETVRMQIQNLTSKYSTSEKSRYISTQIPVIDVNLTIHPNPMHKNSFRKTRILCFCHKVTLNKLITVNTFQGRCNCSSWYSKEENR